MSKCNDRVNVVLVRCILNFPICFRVTAVDGQYQIGIYAVRPIEYGEEITFDYNSVTEVCVFSLSVFVIHEADFVIVSCYHCNTADNICLLIMTE